MVKDLPFSGVSVNNAWASANKPVLDKLLRVETKSIAWFMDDKNHAHEARKAFRSDKKASLTEHEEKQRAVLKNLERLRAERLAREAAKSKDD